MALALYVGHFLWANLLSSRKYFKKFTCSEPVHEGVNNKPLGGLI